MKVGLGAPMFVSTRTGVWGLGSVKTKKKKKFRRGGIHFIPGVPFCK